MRRTLLVLFLVAGTLCFATDHHRDVMRTLDELNAAGLKRDATALAALYTADYFHTNPDGTLMDRATVLDSYRQPTQFTFSSSTRDEERIQLHGDCAVVNLRLTLHGKRGDDAFTSRYRVTYVLRRDHGRWKVANSHSSLLGITPGEKK
jgi:ketosteroid isomerase-like protein